MSTIDTAEAAAAERKKNEFILFGRLSFPKLFVAGAQDGGKPRWTCAVLLDPKDAGQKESIKKVKARITQLYREGTKRADIDPFDLCPDKLALRKGDTKEYDGYAGMWFISAAKAAIDKNGQPNQPPQVIDARNNPLKSDNTLIYAGCYCYFKLRFFFLNHEKGGKQVCCSVEVVKYAKKGDPFGNGTVNIDDMPDVEPEEEDGLDDSGIDEDDDL